MSNLTGQQIQNTYEGLLNLQDSTTGITSNLQAIQDGLGNNTGMRIGTNLFAHPQVFTANASLIPDYMGGGISTAGGAQANTANSQNRLIYNIFYDNGVHSYSALTYNLSTATTVSDVVNFYFYTLQLVPGYGIAPKDLIMSGITISSSAPTGVKTTTLPSTLTFSGTGAGWYVAAYTISNANVTPVVRYNAPFASAKATDFTQPLGFFLSAAGTGTFPGSRVLNQFATAGGLVINNLPVQSSYSVSDIQNNLNSVTATNFIGYALNVIK
jgi:hypothetical protein